MKQTCFSIIVLSACILFAGEDYNLYKQGKKAFIRKEYDRAARIFEETIERYPDSDFYPNCLYFLGKSSYELDDYQSTFDSLSAYLKTPTVSYRDAKELRLRSAYELAKNRSFMKKPLFEALRQQDLDLVLLSAELLLKLNENDVFEPIFAYLETTGSPRKKKRIVHFIESFGGPEELRQLRQASGPEPEDAQDDHAKMLQLVVIEAGDEVLNIMIPVALASYFKDLLSEDQLIQIEKDTKHSLGGILEQAERMNRGDTLLQIKDHEGHTIKIVVK